MPNRGPYHLDPFTTITRIHFPQKDVLIEHPHFWPGVLFVYDDGTWSITEGPDGPVKGVEASYFDIPLVNVRCTSIVDGPGEWVGIGPAGFGDVTVPSDYDPPPGSHSESEEPAGSEDATPDWLYNSDEFASPDHDVFSKKKFGDFRIRQTFGDSDGKFFDFFRISRDSDDAPKATDGGGSVTLQFAAMYVGSHFGETLTFRLQIWKGGFLEVTALDNEYEYKHFREETDTEAETGQNPGGEPFIDAHKSITVEHVTGDPAFPTFTNPDILTLPDLTINLDDGTWSW